MLGDNKKCHHGYHHDFSTVITIIYCSGIANSAIVWFLCDANRYGSFLYCLVLHVCSPVGLN